MQDNRLHALDWLRRRGITNEVIKRFGLRWGRQSELGECIVIPVTDEAGNFLFNKYRRDPLDQSTPKYLYDRGGRTALYGAQFIKNEKRILIVEGELDALVAWSANIPAVSSTGGAQSFQADWEELLADKEIIICYDNDSAGAEGMVKTLEILPKAKILLLPDTAGIKDISDYVARGGNLNELVRQARHYAGPEEVREDKARRLSVWLTTHFHDAYLKTHARVKHQNERGVEIDKRGLRPVSDFLEFKRRKALCLWHKEVEPSLHYYPATNSVYCFSCGRHGDVIDVIRQLDNCSFKEALTKAKL